MKRKQGISLIVLVITIIVMVVLVAAVVVSLSNTGIINKANQAVSDTNLKNVEQMANVVWAEEFMDGKRGETLKAAVLEKLKDYTDKYNITVTDKGVVIGTIQPPLVAVDYYTYEYDTTNMTATVVGVQDKYAEVSYYTVYNTQYKFASAIIGDDGSVITEVAIPSTTKGPDGETYTVTAINSGVFTASGGIGSAGSATIMPKYTRIELPATIKTIGSCAFLGCVNLKTLRIPKSVETIEYSALNYNNTIEDLYFDGDLEDWLVFTSNCSNPMIKTNLYFNDKLVTNVTIPEGTTELAYNTFKGCKSLMSVTLPNSLPNITSYAFSNCINLKEVIIPNGITKISNYAFSNCTSLTEVVIPNSITNIGEGAFSGCTSLTNVTLPNNITSISQSVFNNCTSLTNIVVPESVIKIYNSAFRGCTSLTSITIPNSVTSIGVYAFEGATGLNKINYNGTIKEWQQISLSTDWCKNTLVDKITCSNGNVCVSCSGGTATCQNLAICTTCNNEYGSIGTCSLENGVCTVCGKVVTVIETAHNPYENSQSYVVIGTWDYSDATSVNITITYQTEATSCDWVSVTEGTDYVAGTSYSDTRNYLATSGTISSTTGTTSGIKFGGSTKTTKTFENINMLTGSVIFKTDSSINSYYGVLVEITPNY